MKLINDKGRLFGLINAVDLLALLVVLAVIGGLAWTWSPAKSASASQKVNLTYTVRARGVARQMEDLIRNGVDQDHRLYTPDGEEIDAVLVGVYFEPYIAQNLTADGQMIDADDPARMDVIFTIEAQVFPDDAPLMVGTQEIRMGVNHSVRTTFIEYLGSVETLTFS